MPKRKEKLTSEEISKVYRAVYKIANDLNFGYLKKDLAQDVFLSILETGKSQNTKFTVIDILRSKFGRTKEGTARRLFAFPLSYDLWKEHEGKSLTVSFDDEIPLCSAKELISKCRKQRTQEILWMFYVLEDPQNEICKKFGVNASRISQIITSGLREIRWALSHDPIRRGREPK